MQHEVKRLGIKDEDHILHILQKLLEDAYMDLFLSIK